MAYEKIPTELKNLKQWGNFHKIWVEERQKYTKIPINSYDGSPGKSNDSSTWCSFDEALAGLNKWDNADGLAFYFANGYVGLDIDHIDEDLDRWRNGDSDPSNLVNKIRTLTKNTYLEISLSGKGIHAIFKGKIPGKHRRKGNFEMYEKGRFFALTGNTIQEKPEIISLNETENKELYEFCFGKDKVIPINPSVDLKPIDLSVPEIIKKAEASRTGKRFELFMKGGWESFYNSQSEADMAFANDLAFWTGKDFTKMDTIFRNSSLMREKYDTRRGETTYGKSLLNKAIAETQEIYSEGKEKPYDFSKLKSDKKPTHFSQDDMGNAERFINLFGKKFKYSYTDKNWFCYNGNYWESDESGLIEKAADMVPQYMLKEPLPIDPSLDEKQEQKAREKWEKFISKTRSNKGKKAMLDEVKHHVAIKHGEFDRDKMLLNTESGYVDLTTGELKNHNAKKLMSLMANSEYTTSAQCPMWINFLNQIFNGDEELIHYMQKVLGYTLTGSIAEQSMWMLYGNGRNGKSVFLSVVQAIMGSYARTINIENLMMKSSDIGKPNPEIARLESARVAITSEGNEGNSLNEGLIKQLTGGDRIVARFLYGKDFEFTPQFKILMATNHLPYIRGIDLGIWRRLKIIPFLVQISLDQVDKHLLDKLLSEKAAILNWMIEGCLAWQREGLEPPRAVIDATEGYKGEMDETQQFIDECCDVDENYYVNSSDLYRKYKNWCGENGNYTLSHRKFSQKMKDKFESKHTRLGTQFVGLRIHVDYPKAPWIK
ncbi:phage/plasmid primase, P4 family [Lactobacillus sp.]|uniref:phage/plasmid primase, P4 family n=1 Tax=Lactobacillus sp. TaxID=1591 RepID=UPI0019BDFBC6|nr:phage/plasmid primase, P4 family [Lactobacillus sp.]MBD5429329.1 DNA primase [Lactobacillus sp.]